MLSIASLPETLRVVVLPHVAFAVASSSNASSNGGMDPSTASSSLLGPVELFVARLSTKYGASIVTPIEVFEDEDGCRIVTAAFRDEAAEERAAADLAEFGVDLLDRTATLVALASYVPSSEGKLDAHR